MANGETNVIDIITQNQWTHKAFGGKDAISQIQTMAEKNKT